MDGLLAQHWILAGVMLAVLCVLFEVLLPAAILRLPYRWEGILVRVVASGMAMYLTARAFYRFYLERQLDLEDGLLALAERYVTTYNAYFGSSVQLPPGKEEFLPLALLWCILLVLAAQYLLTQLTGLRIMALAAPLCVIASEMWVGQTPDVRSMFLFSASCMFLAVGRQKRAVSKAAAVGLWLFLFGLSVLILNGPAERLIQKAPEFKAYQKRLEASVRELSTANLWGKRETVSNKKPEYSDKEILTVSADRLTSGNLYLKAFVGTTYTNGSWAEDTGSFSDAAENAGIDEADLTGRLWNTVWNENEKGTLGIQARKTEFTIHYTRNLQNNALLPYFVSTEGLENVSYVADQKLKVKWGTKEITASGFGAYDADNLLRLFAANYDAASDEAWDWYGSYVQEQYMETGTQLEAVSSIAGQLGNVVIVSRSVSYTNRMRLAVAETVSDYLEKNYTYSWNLDSITDGTDPVEYFLATGKKGYCMHFASAGTLILRQMGIPARYVEGYIVKSGEFSRDEDGNYTTAVLDRNAHAWTEIYLENIGWVPIEMTPGFSDAGSVLPTDKTAAEEREKDELANNSDVEQNASEENFEEGDTQAEDSEASETEENTEEQSPGNTENQENENDSADSNGSEDSFGSWLFGGGGANSGTGSGGGETGGSDRTDGTGGNVSGTFQHSTAFLRFIRLILACAALIGFAALARLLCRIIKKRIRAYHAYVGYEIQKRHYRRAIQCVNRRIYRKAGRGIRIGGRQLTDREYGQLLCSTFPEIPAEDWNHYMEIVKEAAFSADEPGEEEARFCAKIYDEILVHNL
jgi:hypothetical protein